MPSSGLVLDVLSDKARSLDRNALLLIAATNEQAKSGGFGSYTVLSETTGGRLPRPDFESVRLPGDVRTRRRHGRKQRSEAVQTACPQRRCVDPDAARR